MRLNLTERLLVGLGAILIAIAVIIPIIAKANPPLFSVKGSAAATTTVNYMIAGTATTTLSYDSVNDGNGDLFAANSAALMMQFAGSSTAAVLNVNIQYSQNGIDWYSIAGGTDIDNGIGSSSPSVTNPSIVVWTFSSTTQDGLAITNANSATSTRMVNVDMPSRYVRAVVSMPAGSTNGAFWGQFVTQKQNR